MQALEEEEEQVSASYLGYKARAAYEEAEAAGKACAAAKGSKAARRYLSSDSESEESEESESESESG
eukprot:6463603-Pyramimonas_sp.AAC.1